VVVVVAEVVDFVREAMVEREAVVVALVCTLPVVESAALDSLGAEDVSDA
jgi:hypothetical protein